MLFLRGILLVFKSSIRRVIMTRRTVLLCMIGLLPLIGGMVYSMRLSQETQTEYHSVTTVDKDGNEQVEWKEEEVPVVPNTWVGDELVASAMVIFVHMLSMLFALFFGTQVLRDEIDAGTLTYLTTRPVGKTAILIGKYLAVVVVPGAMLSLLLLAFFATAGSTGGARFLSCHRCQQERAELEQKKADMGPYMFEPPTRTRAWGGPEPGYYYVDPEGEQPPVDTACARCQEETTPDQRLPVEERHDIGTSRGPDKVLCKTCAKALEGVIPERIIRYSDHDEWQLSSGEVLIDCPYGHGEMDRHQLVSEVRLVGSTIATLFVALAIYAVIFMLFSTLTRHALWVGIVFVALFTVSNVVMADKREMAQRTTGEQSSQITRYMSIPEHLDGLYLHLVGEGVAGEVENRLMYPKAAEDFEMKESLMVILAWLCAALGFTVYVFRTSSYEFRAE